MKAVMISIQPKWVELIASGKKTIEVRKTRPKIDTPFKCYIYETIERVEEIVEEYDSNFNLLRRKKTTKQWGGRVIGEFVCDRISEYFYDQAFDESMGCFLNSFGYDIMSGELEQTCLSYEELEKYGNTNMLYGWHISDLKIYDKPKELSEFQHYCEKQPCQTNCWKCDKYDYIGDVCYDTITRPPQSWCYVEEKENGTLVELPCKVGDKVYSIYRYDVWLEEDLEHDIIPEEVVDIIVKEGGFDIGTACRMIGKFKRVCVCFTKPEAEAKLEQIRKGE